MAKKLNIPTNSRTAETIAGFIDQQIDRTEESEKKTPMNGRRRTDLIRDNSVQAGLTADYTRATFILKVDTLKELKDYAYTERKPIKDALEEIISDFLTNYKKNNELLDHSKK